LKYRVTHATRYGYHEAIPLSHNVVRMRPRDHETQACLQYQMLVLPAPTVRNEGFDYFGNHVTWFSLQEPHTVLRIAAQSEVQVLPSGPCDVNRGPTWEEALQILNVARTGKYSLPANSFLNPLTCPGRWNLPNSRAVPSRPGERILPAFWI